MIAHSFDEPLNTPANEALQNRYEPTEMQAPDMFECIKHYAQRHPEKFALWCFGIGFVLGWRLKPW